MNNVLSDAPVFYSAEWPARQKSGAKVRQTLHLKKFSSIKLCCSFQNGLIKVEYELSQHTFFINTLFFSTKIPNFAPDL